MNENERWANLLFSYFPKVSPPHPNTLFTPAINTRCLGVYAYMQSRNLSADASECFSNASQLKLQFLPGLSPRFCLLVYLSYCWQLHIWRQPLVSREAAMHQPPKAVDSVQPEFSASIWFSEPHADTCCHNFPSSCPPSGLFHPASHPSDGYLHLPTFPFSWWGH